MKYYAIYSKSENAWWSNLDGWGDMETATVFSEKDILKFGLPGATENDAGWVWIPTDCLSSHSRAKHIVRALVPLLNVCDPAPS